MANSVLSCIGPGLDHAAPELLELLQRVQNDIANYSLLREEETPLPAGDAVEVDCAVTDATKDTKAASGTKGRTKKGHPGPTGNSASIISPTVTGDAAATVLAEPAAVDEDEFDQQIKALQAQAEEELKASMELEQYLIEQHEAAQRTTAAEIATKDQLYTRFWRYSGVPLPTAKPQLDSSRIRAAGLLDTSAVLQQLKDAQQKTVLSPPTTKAFSDNTALPHYLANTAANKNRQSGRQDAIARCRKSIREGKAFTWHSLPKEELDAAVKASRRRQKLSGLRMNGDQWDAERRVIQRIREKLNFTRNPRFQDTVPRSEIPAIQDPLLSRPMFGVGCVQKRPQTKPRLTSSRDTSFICEPANVMFSDWQPGCVYDYVVQIRNVSATLQRVRVLPATTQYFHVSRLIFPATEGVIAPGVHCEVRIKFTPDSLANFSDRMTVVTEKGEIAVPLVAHRNPPVLEMESQVSLGAVYVGNSVKRQVVVRAQHGDGAFRVVSSRAWANCGQDVDMMDRLDLPGGFTISPTEFHLSPGETVTLDIGFSPAARGPVEASYMILCDNCHHCENTVTGRGVEPDATIVSLDGHPYKFTAGAVRFLSTMPGSWTKRTLSVRNACVAPLPFRWVISYSAQQSARSGHAAGAITLRPEHGVMGPEEEVLFDVVFAPSSPGMFVCAANFEMEPSAVSDACGKAQAATRRIQLHFEGFGPVHPASVYPLTLSAPEVLEVGSTFTQSFIIKNPSDTAARFSISGASHGPVAVSVQQGIVAPRSEDAVHVVASAGEVLNLQHTICCHIEHGDSFPVHVCGMFAQYLPVQILTAGIDFGLVARGTVVVRTLQLRNPSLFNAAPWSVSCVAPAVHTAATLEAPVTCGVLQPEALATVQLRCTGVAAGTLCGHARIYSHGAVMMIPVRATIVAPHIALGPNTHSFALGTIYIGIPVIRSIHLMNDTDVEAHWQLRPELIGTVADSVQSEGQPDSGVLAARATQVISVTMTPHHMGSMDGLLVIDVDHAEQPIAVAFSCRSESLRVEYSILEGQADTEPDAACAEVALHNRVISFGECVAVGDVVALQLILTNPTGIEAPVELSLDHFAASDDLVTSTGHRMHMPPNYKQTSKSGPLPQGAALLLGNEHERTALFRSQVGKELLATRAVQKAAQALLVDRGIAIKLSAEKAVLPPFGRCKVGLQLVSNCVGSYLDRLWCRVGDLEPEHFWVRAGVIGSPVHVQREGMFISGLHKHVCASTGLDFGSVPQNIPVDKSFFLFNQSSFNVELNLVVHTWEKKPGSQLVDVDLQVQADGHVVVSSRARTTTAEEYASFTVQPQCVQLAPGMSKKVSVHFVSSIAIHHEAYVLGTQQLRYSGESTTTAAILIHADSQLPEMVLRGSFHPHAGPPPAPVPPLKVALSSHCVQAKLEHGQQRPLNWVVHSIHGPSAGSRQQTITFCNHTGSPLRFHMYTEGPFEVMSVVTSVPQEPHMYTGSKCFVAMDGDEGGSGSSFLPPQESVDVTLLCVLAASKCSAQDYSATGVLRLCFSNGQVQEEALVASVLHPQLQCLGKGGAPMQHLDFGRVAVRSYRELQIVLENSSTVDAVWSAVMCEADAAPAGAAGVEVANAHACKDSHEDSESKADKAALQGFSAAPGRGVLHGSQPEWPCAKAILRVRFSPEAVGECRGELHFMTKGGDPCKLTMQGTATLDERDEPGWKLTEFFQ